MKKGTNLLNGVDIRKYDEQEYRRLFSAVFQNFQIFSLALGENIAESMQMDEAKAMYVILRAGMEGLYRKMPDGLATMINRDFSGMGMEFSGGEEQKLAMARAIYKDAPFIILNEPRPWTPSRRTRSIRAFTISSGTRPPCSSPTGCPPAAFPKRFWYLKTEMWFSGEAMRSWRNRKACTAGCGRHRRSIINRVDFLGCPVIAGQHFQDTAISGKGFLTGPVLRLRTFLPSGSASRCWYIQQPLPHR